jgi:radical SAM superfamily enzyme YgiQ (UPF0313 family)
MLLIFPPIAKPCEPPAGVALLSAALKEHGFPCEVVDANVEGILHLIRSDVKLTDPWSRRAVKKREAILAELKGPALYTHTDRYHQRVYDLNHMLAISVDQKRFKISLSDYSDNVLSSVRSADLLKSAAQYKENPFYGFFEAGLRERVENSSSNYVGLSICYLNQALTGFALAGWIRDNFRDKKIIMGGGLISSWMSRPDYTHPFDGLVDVCIRGEGELPLLELLGQGKGTKKHYVPDYDFVKEDLYLAPGLVLPFRASIGCYWSKCRFCPEKAETRPYSSQRASKVLEDLKAVEERYRPSHVHLIDNAVTPALLKALSHEEFSFKWYGFVRFEKDFLDPEFCMNLKRSGCDMLKLGLESGDQGVLDQMNKGTDLGMVSKILENLHEAKILTFVYLLFGTSFEDRAAAHKTLDFVKAHEAYIDYLNLAVFNLPKFSEDAKGLETWDFYHGDLSLYLNFTHPLGWDRKQVKQFIQKIFKKQVGAGSGVRKNPAFFSSNHAVFFKRIKEEA